MIITVRFSTSNGPTEPEIEWVRNAILDTLLHRGELKDPDILSVVCDPPARAGIYRPQPILSEELWQAIKARMAQEQMRARV